jgi:hypothetical protein
VLPNAADDVSRGDHYDWMFEVQGQLLSWASERLAPPDQAAAVPAILLAPHRLIYLDYQGAVSGNRGTVRRIEAGSHRLIDSTADRYRFALSGGRCGTLAIYRTARDSSSEAWRISFAPGRDDRPTRAEANW